MDCFVVFGRKAIDIFLPYKNDDPADHNDILISAYSKLKNDKLIGILKKIVIEYPEKLNEAELRYLTTLASRAEKFYSLGIEKAEYEKIKNLQIKDLVVFVDTNILYSILSLRVHAENAAIFELMRIANSKQIDLRIMYLPKTYSELQKVKGYLEKIIPLEKFKIGQIKALLNSDKLDSFARKFYEAKLENSDLPHPSEKLFYSKDFLKNQGIIIYNNRFPFLEEDEKYLNDKICEYVDFQVDYNKLCDEKGYNFHLNKDVTRIEHDVFLREAVRNLKSKFNKENELRYICLTLDRGLIHFDHFSLRNEFKGMHEVVNPNFILPSVFIKKIRPFIPITTNDYRKAFITALTAPDFEKENDKESVLIQKSMTYFKNMGIDDEEVILNCVKRELFLEDFEKNEKIHKAEEFIESQVALEIKRIRREKRDLELSLKKEEEKASLVIQEKEFEKQQVAKEKHQEVHQLETVVHKKELIISSLEDRIKQLEVANEKENAIREQERKKIELDQKIAEWNNEKTIFVNAQWNIQIAQFNEALKYFFIVFLITLIPIMITFLLKASDNIVAKLDSIGIKEKYLWLICVLFFIIELAGRSYLFDKEKVKSGFQWLCAFFANKKYNAIMYNCKKRFENDYISTAGIPPEKKI